MAVPCRDEREGAARLVAVTTAYRSLVASSQPSRGSSFERQEPNLGGRRAPSLAPEAQDEEEFEEETEEDDDEEEEAPVARAPRKKAAPRAPSRKSSDKFELPSVSVLTAPKASRPAAAQQG